MGDSQPEVFVAVFEDALRASLVDGRLAALEGGGQIALLAAAVISRDDDGRVGWSVRGRRIDHICSHADTIATMLGVLLPTPLLVAGLTAAASEGTGDGDAERELGEWFLSEMAGGVAPGTSVFIGVIEDRWAAEIVPGLRGYHRLTRDRS